jgi:hypothetical protein
MFDEKQVAQEFAAAIRVLNEVLGKARTAGLQADVKVSEHATVGNAVAQKIVAGTLSKPVSVV